MLSNFSGCKYYWSKYCQIQPFGFNYCVCNIETHDGDFFFQEKREKKSLKWKVNKFFSSFFFRQEKFLNSFLPGKKRIRFFNIIFIPIFYTYYYNDKIFEVKFRKTYVFARENNFSPTLPWNLFLVLSVLCFCSHHLVTSISLTNFEFHLCLHRNKRFKLFFIHFKFTRHLNFQSLIWFMNWVTTTCCLENWGKIWFLSFFQLLSVIQRTSMLKVEV